MGLHARYNLAGWAAVYRDWKSAKLQYYWRKHRLTVVPRDMSLLNIHRKYVLVALASRRRICAE